MEASFKIPEGNVARLEADFARLAKRATRLGVVAPVLTLDRANLIVTRAFADREDGGTREVIRRYVPATIVGETPRLPGGWTLAAVLTRVEDGNVIASLVGEVPVEYRTAPPVCDHCKLARARKDTFLVRSDAGEIRQIGRNCLSDFLGGVSPEDVLVAAELLASALGAARAGEDEDYGGGSSYERVFALDEFLAYVCMLVRTDGWCGRKEARERGERGATADQVMRHMRPARGARDVLTPTAADRARAEAAIEWASEIEVTSDFEHNLCLLARAGYVEPRHFGVAAYMPVAHDRMLQDAARAALPAPTGPSAHFGVVGVRAVYTLTVLALRGIEGEYGLTTLVSFRDAAGNIAKWFCSGEAPDGFDVGTSHTVKATVKKHGEFRGAAETTLSRVAVFVPPPPKAPRKRKAPAAA
jgi:hypothetical protein